MAMSDETQTLALQRVFGISCSHPSCIINLHDGVREQIAYIAGHTAVLLDVPTRKQTFLQGHCSSITCMSATADRMMLVTADAGPTPLMVVWNARNGTPVFTVELPLQRGVVAMDISADGQQLVTITSTPGTSGEQEILLWDLAGMLKRSEQAAEPLLATAIPVGDAQHCVRFNVNSPTEIISNGKRRVYFWATQLPSVPVFKYYSPPLRSKDFKQNIGDFVASCFAPGTTQAMTATEDGDVIVWEQQGVSTHLGTKSTDRKAAKLVHLHNSAITVLHTAGTYIMTAAEDGYVRFYDSVLRLCAWFEDVDAGGIVSASFAVTSKVFKNADDSTLNRFDAPDLVVLTRQAAVVAITSAAFDSPGPDNAPRSLMVNMITNISDMASHPIRPEFAVTGKDGTLQRWDSSTNRLVASTSFDGTAGTALAYSRDGASIVVGLASGEVHMLNANTLERQYTSRNTSSPIIKLAASSSGRHLALQDDKNQVMLYHYAPYKSSMRWEYVGRARPHHGQVVGLQMGESPAGATRLFSLGVDGRLVEYDLDHSSPAKGLVLKSTMELAETAVNMPTALCFAPPRLYFDSFNSDTLLMIADGAYKIRLYNPDEQATIAVYQGPSYGHPIKRMRVFRWSSTDTYCIAYNTGDQVSGLVMWPLDGNPAHSMGLVAHPGVISSTAVSCDGKKLLTAGLDGMVSLWDINVAALTQPSPQDDRERRLELVGSLALLDDLQDYFCYAQLRAQGEDISQPRNVPGKIPSSMVADVLRAVGYYPSEEEAAVLRNHIQYMHGVQAQDSEQEAMVDLDHFISLYINHRPVAGVTKEEIHEAFSAIAGTAEGAVSASKLLQLLGSQGDKMGAQELGKALQVLTGTPQLQELFPDVLDAALFSSEVLGFEE